MKERAAYGSVKEWLSAFEVGEQKHILLGRFKLESIRQIAWIMKRDYGCRYKTVKNGQMLIVTRME